VDVVISQDKEAKRRVGRGERGSNQEGGTVR
jgi:hypothetical protein